MIGRLTGKVTLISPGEIIVDVAGVGYQVKISYNTYYQVSDNEDYVTLLVHTHVREGDISLYGFSDDMERKLFRMLISISGIGPKLAINILSGISPDDLISAVENVSIARLNAIPGVGKKTAERISIEMRDKIKHLTDKDIPSSFRKPDDDTETVSRHEIISALINLGFKRQNAEMAFDKSIRTVEESSNFEVVLKQCLNYLSGGLAQ